MPLDLAGVAIERDGRGRVEIVARPLIAEPGRGVAGAPVDRIGVGIVVAGHPGGCAAGLPGVGFLPGLAAGLAGRRNGEGLPCGLAGFGVERCDKAAHAELAAGDADQHFALHDQRGHGHVIAGLPVLDLGFPGNLAGFRVERDERRVERRKIDLVAVERHAAAGIVQRAEARGQLALVAPQQIASGRVQRHDLAVRRGDEHHAVVDDRRGFVAGVNTGRHAPDRDEILHVAGVDLIERTVAPSLVTAAGHEPVFRLGIGQTSVGHRRIVRRVRRAGGVRRPAGRKARAG